MKAIFLNTFYANNLSGASYAVHKRLELFTRHCVNTLIIGTQYRLTNRYYFSKHFPKELERYLDVIDILTDNIYVPEKNIKSLVLANLSLNFILDKQNYKAKGSNGTYCEWELFPDQRLKKIDFYNRDKQIVRTDCYDWRGFMTSQSFYSRDNLGKIYIAKCDYFNHKGQVKLIYHYDDNKTIRRIDWLKNNRQIKSFTNDDDLLIAALLKYTNNADEYLIITDLFVNNTLAKLKRLNQQSNIKLFMQLHNIQIKQEPSSKPIRIGYSYPVLNHKQYTGVVVLTKNQKSDIEGIVGFGQNIYQIPENWYSDEDVNLHDTVNWNEKEDGLIIVSARLENVKQIDHVIMAIAAAHEKVSNVHLEIWGGGTQWMQLKNVINKYDAQEFVKLMGIASNNQMKKRLRDAQLHILTSTHEGLPMVLFEAQLGGTPSLCYDIDYGPADIIFNHQNGELITPNDYKYLSKRVVDLFSDKNQKTLRQYSKNTVYAIEKYHERKVWNKWDSLIHTLFEL